MNQHGEWEHYRTFLCEVCQQKFADKAAFFAHARDAHKIDTATGFTRTAIAFSDGSGFHERWYRLAAGGLDHFVMLEGERRIDRKEGAHGTHNE